MGPREALRHLARELLVELDWDPEDPGDDGVLPDGEPARTLAIVGILQGIALAAYDRAYARKIHRAMVLDEADSKLAQGIHVPGIKAVASLTRRFPITGEDD